MYLYKKTLLNKYVMVHKNIKEWKTTLIGLVTLILSFYYLFEVDNSNVWIFVVLLIYATMMLFSADTMVNSLSKFIFNNRDKKI